MKVNKKLAEFLGKGIILTIAVSLWLLVYITLTTPVPMVHISTSTGRCVKVMFEGKEYDCSIWKDIKDKHRNYDPKWVK